jgi:hypothetical protein
LCTSAQSRAECGDARGFRLDSDLTRGRSNGIRAGAAPRKCGATSIPCRPPNPRYTVTDTGELSDQLDQAQRRWPEIKDRKDLLLKLTAAGHDAIAEEASERARAVEETAGALSGVYEPDELERLREDWPE